MKAALCALLIFGIIGGSFAVECYSCTKLFGAGCDDPFAPNADSQKETCEGKCYKSKTSFNGATTTLHRSCQTSCVADNSCTEVLGIQSCNYCCDGDLCNSAGAIAVNLVAMATMVAAAMAMTL